MEKQEEIEFAKKVVSEANHSFLNKEDITSNIEENGILVSESVNIGFTSHLEYDSVNKRGILAYDALKPLKEQQQILLMNYCVLKLNEDKNIKYYYKDIPSKSALKRISRYIINASVDKEFGGDSFQNIKEVKKL